MNIVGTSRNAVEEGSTTTAMLWHEIELHNESQLFGCVVNTSNSSGNSSSSNGSSN